MTSNLHRLAFEKPVYELEARLEKLEQAEAAPETQDEIRKLRRQRAEALKKVYSNLEPWETVQVARHQDRPKTSDYLALAFDEFVELHGDRALRRRPGHPAPASPGSTSYKVLVRRPSEGPHAQGAQRLLLRLRPSRRLPQGAS